MNGTRTPQTLILRNFKGRTLLAEGLGPNGGRLASASARVGGASRGGHDRAQRLERRRREVAEVLRERPHATRFQLVGGGTEMGIADAARGIVDAGLVDRPLTQADPPGLIFTPLAGSDTLGLVTRGAPPEDLARIVRWIAQTPSYIHERPWSRRPPSTRSWTSTVATTTWRPTPTTPSGASRSARSATSRCSGSSTKLLGPTPGRSRARWRSAPARATSRLNLLQTGVIGEATCTDISPGMLATLEHNARELGLDVETAACDASELPFEDESFDLVLGHAVLHHLPDLDACFAEFMRVLKPGGTLFFAGEPSRSGDTLAAYPKRAAVRVAPLWRRAIKARPAPAHHGDHDEQEHALEAVVDVHAFVPADLERHARPPGSTPSRSGARSCSRTGSGGSTGRSRRPRTTRTSRWAGSSTPTTATSRFSAWTASRWSRACPRGSSTT